MTEQELRALVRDAIARHAASTAAEPSRHGLPVAASPRQHFSHAMFQVAAGSDGDGACIIEPTVGCNHCGYCKSVGH
jgi:hypothetical protein